MPRRRDKRTDTENSDDYIDQKQKDKVTYYGAAQFNRFLAPDKIQGDDVTKYSIRAWTNTLQAQRLLPWPQRKQLFERAISYLPYSYKIWAMYLSQYMDFCSGRSLLSKQYRLLNETFERALEKLPKMPRIWIMYSQCLDKQHLVSKARSVYNWSFKNLPLTQHEKIWHKFSVWSMKLDNTVTALSTIPRYLKLNPDFKEKYADYLYEKKLYNKCLKVFQEILDDEGYSSKAKMSKKDFHLRMIDIITEHADDIDNELVDGQRVIRSAIQKYEQEVGKLWVKLSDYFIRLGQLDKARDCLEEAIKKIDNAKDFGVIFNAYCKFEQEMITVLADKNYQQEENVVPQDKVDEAIEARLNDLNNFIERRPYLLHNINLRKNPNNVKEWVKLANLYRQSGNQGECLATLSTALERIKPEEAWEGKLSQIVVEIGRMHQTHGDIKMCNEVMHNGTTLNYRLIEDYFNIWISWVEILMQERYYNDALKIIKHILFRRKPSQNQESRVKNIDELLKSHTNIWQLYIDLQISLGNFESTKIAYERCKQHRCLTPIMLLNFTEFLWKSDYFEEAFRVFQFAVGNFKWPSLFQIWMAYIHKFIKRYGQDGIGVERTRSMFERLLKEVPRDKSGIFFYLYAQFEQEYGLYSHSIQIYDRMVNSVPEQQRYQAYNIYIAKVSKLLGITKTRAIFDIALKKLSQKQVLVLGRKYADLQIKMGQVERARAIYTYVSQFTDPKDDRKGLWEEWQKFEVQYGDKNTYKQHRRIKRSVQAKFMMLPPDLEKIEQEIKKGLVQ